MSRLKEIAFPTDYTNYYEAKLLHYLTSKSGYNNAAVRFLYLNKLSEILNKEQRWNKETLKDYFADKQLNYFLLAKHLLLWEFRTK